MPRGTFAALTMLFNVTHVRGDHDRFEKRYEPSAFASDDQPYRVVEPVWLSFEITKDDRRFHLDGSVRTTLELSCGRCLEPFRLEIDAPFDLRYLPRSDNAGEGEIEIEEDDLTTAYYADDVIDLGQLMAEQFHLALPMKPLCRQSCRGLCPQCGTNPNTASCECRTSWEDPRLAPLKSLLKDRELS
jgi:uncharacterized protein